MKIVTESIPFDHLCAAFQNESKIQEIPNVLTEDEDKQHIEDFGLDQDVEVFGGITLRAKYSVGVILCMHTPVDGRKRFENAIV